MAGTSGVVASALELSRLVSGERADAGLHLLRLDLAPVAAAVLAAHLGGQVRRRPVAELHELIDEDLAALREAGLNLPPPFPAAGRRPTSSPPRRRRPCASSLRWNVLVRPSPSRVWLLSPTSCGAWCVTPILRRRGGWQRCVPNETPWMRRSLVSIPATTPRLRTIREPSGLRRSSPWPSRFPETSPESAPK